MMNDGEVDIRLLALRRQQKRRNTGMNSASREHTQVSLEPTIPAENFERIATEVSHRSYETTPIKAYSSLLESPRNGEVGTPRRNSYLGSLPVSLFDEDTRIGRMHVPPVIRCDCNGIEACALISTSETVSTISMDFIRKLRLLDQIIPDSAQVYNPLVLHQTELKGKVKYIDLSIGSWQQVAQFNIVENYISDVTLGIDFLRRTQSVVNFQDSALMVGGNKGERIPFLTSREVISLARRNTNKSKFVVGNGFSDTE